MSKSETRLTVGLTVDIDTWARTADIKLNKKDNEDPSGEWKIEVADILWDVFVKRFELPSDESGWKILESCLLMQGNNLPDSSLWEIDSTIDYTVDIDVDDELYQFHGLITNVVDFKNYFNTHKMFRVRNIEKICEMSDLSGRQTFVGTVTMRIKMKTKNIHRAIDTSEFSVLKKTPGFSNVEFVFEDGKKLYANKAVFSASSPPAAFFFGIESKDSYEIGPYFEEWYIFLSMMFPSSDQTFDPSQMLAVLGLGDRFEAQSVLQGVERFLINSQNVYFDDELEEIMKIAEKNNLNRLLNWCYETKYMYEQELEAEKARHLAFMKCSEAMRESIRDNIELEREYNRFLEQRGDRDGDHDDDVQEGDEGEAENPELMNALQNIIDDLAI